MHTMIKYTVLAVFLAAATACVPASGGSGGMSDMLGE